MASDLSKFSLSLNVSPLKPIIKVLHHQTFALYSMTLAMDTADRCGHSNKA